MDQRWFAEYDRLQRELVDLLAIGLDQMARSLMQGLPLDADLLSRLAGMGQPGVPKGQMPLAACYQIMGLPPDASWDEVKHRYRELVWRLHPDKAGPETAHLFKMVQFAYEQIRESKEMKR
jgi:DnaJ-class molecular chaperone